MLIVHTYNNKIHYNYIVSTMKYSIIMIHNNNTYVLTNTNSYIFYIIAYTQQIRLTSFHCLNMMKQRSHSKCTHNIS